MGCLSNWAESTHLKKLQALHLRNDLPKFFSVRDFNLGITLLQLGHFSLLQVAGVLECKLWRLPLANTGGCAAGVEAAKLLFVPCSSSKARSFFLPSAWCLFSSILFFWAVVNPLMHCETCTAACKAAVQTGRWLALRDLDLLRDRRRRRLELRDLDLLRDRDLLRDLRRRRLELRDLDLLRDLRRRRLELRDLDLLRDLRRRRRRDLDLLRDLRRRSKARDLALGSSI